VKFLHSKKIVHRDIKPENIYISNKLKPLLGDFGTSGKTTAIRNSFCGTLEYMAPELYLKRQ